MQRNLAEMTVQYGLPVWHAPAHTEECQEENDLSLKPGVGKTDGEGIERFWSGLNPAAYSTKEMGLGHRADVIDDRIDNHNFLKNLTLGSTLQRRLVVAREERQRQIDAFEVVSEGIEPELQLRWTKQVREWESDNASTNPFVLQSKECLSEAQIRLQLQHEEKQQSIDGRALIAGGSATSFVAAGIQIEDAQERIRVQLKEPYVISATHELKTEELRATLTGKIARFRELQAIYMPGAASILAATRSSPRTRCHGGVPATTISTNPMGAFQVLLRSGAAARVSHAGLSRIEMPTTRDNDKPKRRNLFSVCTGRANPLLPDTAADMPHWYNRVVDKYPHLRQLQQTDLQLDGDSDFADIDARRKLATIGSGRGMRPPRNMPSKSRKTMSWIWTAPGAFDNQEAHLHDSMRVQWTRALARKERWEEEVALLEEEMRRVFRRRSQALKPAIGAQHRCLQFARTIDEKLDWRIQRRCRGSDTLVVPLTTGNNGTTRTAVKKSSIFSRLDADRQQLTRLVPLEPRR
ncbi:CxC2 domain-containing protein [Mycena chlorophos]|uniref:CxC2 domain-containing protein n=1 Tax=Mycena chlorophos TaxID=658473 RepID=A0A8H6S1B5_MYCCL|nr:CxC2 domain-containing protein [Mycena chlorophos]